MSDQLPYGEVHGQPVGEMSRRSFMRRMLGIGVGVLTLQFLGGTVAFLWPNVKGGLGSEIPLGTAADIAINEPEWPRGRPAIYQNARSFIVNVPAAMALVDGTGVEVADPGDQVVALYRKCPHLGCQVPQLCDQSKWFECLCHGSKYTVLGEKRDGPAPRGLDSFRVRLEDGVYLVDTRVIITGPPIGTATFDNRATADIPHCAA